MEISIWRSGQTIRGKFKR